MKKKISTWSIILLAGILPAITGKAQESNQETKTKDPAATQTADEPELHKNEFGIRYLPTFTDLSLRNYNGEVVKGTVTANNGFGVMFAHNISSVVGLQIEINYDKISQKYKDRGLDQKVTIDYFNIPLLLSLCTPKTNPVFFGIVVGPQFGINAGSKLNGNNQSETDTLHAVVAVKQGDVGLAYGAGFGIALNEKQTVRVDFGFRGMYGLVDINGTPTADNTYNVLVKGSRKVYGGYAGITFLF